MYRTLDGRLRHSLLHLLVFAHDGSSFWVRLIILADKFKTHFSSTNDYPLGIRIFYCHPRTVLTIVPPFRCDCGPVRGAAVLIFTISSPLSLEAGSVDSPHEIRSKNDEMARYRIDF